MTTRATWWVAVATSALVAGCGGGRMNNGPDAGCPMVMTDDMTMPSMNPSDPFFQNAQQMLADGRQTFRFDTFGDEAFWGDTLQLHKAIAGQAHGGVGAGLTPTAALAAGLKVDMGALPASLVHQI